MKLYTYKDYDEYRAAQIRGNTRSITWQWVKEEEIREVAGILLNKMGNVEFGICHGTRRGNEQKWFSQYLNAEVLGTDISTTATDFPNTIEWDFHYVKDEWLGKVDFIYSNSLDHSYDPELALRQWMSCLNPGGYCLLHWSVGHKTSTKRDPFGANLEEYREMIARLGYVIEEETEQECGIRPGRETMDMKYLLWLKR